MDTAGGECGASAWALATLGWAPSPWWIAALSLHLEAHAVCNMDAQALSNLLWALGRWNLSVPLGLMDAVQTALSPSVLQRCSPQALSNILWGFARLGHKPGPAWMASYWKAEHKTARWGLAGGGKGSQCFGASSSTSALQPLHLGSSISGGQGQGSSESSRAENDSC